MRIPHPIPYQGSKRALASVITDYFPRDADRLVEPFAGSAAVSIAAAFYGEAKRFTLSDINRALIDLWREIIDRPEGIATGYERLWREQLGQERQFYDDARDCFNRTQRPDYFLYLLARCVKASVRYNPAGDFNQSPDNRRKGAEPSTMRARIIGASRLLKGKTELACADYKDALSNLTTRDIVYMDPPYKGVCGGKDKRYKGTLSFDEYIFVDILRRLNARGVSFMVSYDGRTGEKTFGEALPQSLGLTRLEIEAGRSSQATLLGRDDITVESLYLSPALVDRLGDLTALQSRNGQRQLSLLTFDI
jgi:DNA adenine methylase